MAKATSPRHTERPEPALSKRDNLDPATASLVARLARARTVNEMSVIVGLKPIKGRSGPKIAY